MGPVFLLRVVFSPALQPRFQLLSQSTRLQPLHGMLSFLPLHCLNQPLSDSSGRLQVYLCWGREAVSACPRSGRRGLGRWVLWEWARGHAVGYRWTAPGAVLCTPICSMFVQTPLCIMLICNYNKHFYLSFIYFFFFKCIWCNSWLSNGPTKCGWKISPCEGARTASACQLLLFTRLACTKIEMTVMSYLHTVALDFLHQPTDSGSS